MKTVIKHKVQLFTVLTFFILCACTGGKNLSQNKTKNLNSDPGILFVSVLFEKNINGRINIVENNISITEGTMKKGKVNIQEFENNYLLCSFLDKNNKLIKQKKFPDPFIKIVEYVSENGELRKETIELEKEWLNFRIEYPENLSKLNFEIFNENKSQELGIIKVNK
ncbi:hypothetical protein ACFLTI_02355 [Bacteroidota bacterium]